VNKNQRELKAVNEQLKAIGVEAKSLQDTANTEDRVLTDEEKSRVDDLFSKRDTLTEQKARIEDSISVEQEINELGKTIAVKEETQAQEAVAEQSKSIGEQFVESKAYKLAAMQGGSALKSIDSVEVKATLTEGGGGAGLITPQYQPGVLPKLFQRLTIADLLASGTTTSPTVTYMVESVANGSAVSTVAEGGEKPEVELAYEQKSVSVKKIAGVLPVTDEMLEDATQLSSYINSRLTLFVKQREETELLSGAGTGTHLKGILPQIPSENKEVANLGYYKADAIFSALTTVRNHFIEPDGIVIHPHDWAVIRLAKDGQKNYIGGSPFSNTGSNPGESLFGVPVVVTTAMTEGTALVGAFQTCAQIFRRSGLTVETSNSHANFFRENLTAIRAEERLALAVYRPEGFATTLMSSGS
jgi:HK97 family phage major capsid protein